MIEVCPVADFKTWPWIHIVYLGEVPQPVTTVGRWSSVLLEHFKKQCRNQSVIPVKRQGSWCTYPPIPVLQWMRAASGETNSLAILVYPGLSSWTESSRCWCRRPLAAECMGGALTESATPVQITSMIFLVNDCKMGMIKLLWELTEIQ